MNKNKHCPIFNKPCMRDKCAWFAPSQIRVTNLKTGKSGIKDNSNCAIELLGEHAAMKMWLETEKLINQQDKHCGNCGKKDWCKAYAGYGENTDCDDWIANEPCLKSPYRLHKKRLINGEDNE